MRKLIAAIPVFMVLLSGCLSTTPFQSARTLEKDESSFTTSVMHNTVDNGSGRTGWSQVEWTGRRSIVGGKSDIFVSAGLLMFNGPSFGGTIGFGMKLEFWEDILALELPAKFMLAGTNPVDSTHFYPRLIASIPLGDATEFNLSTTRYFYVGGNNTIIPTGYCAGLAFGKKGEMIIRTEVGVLNNYYNDHPAIQLGFSFTPAVSSKVSDPGQDPNPDLR